MAKPFELDEVWSDRIKRILDGLEYGTVQIVVHDGKIAQIDRTERKRFDNSTQTQAPKSTGKTARQTSQ
jgi:hypothetical protein